MTTTERKKAWTCVWAAAVALVTACGWVGGTRQQAQAKVDEFHSLLDAAKFAEIYAAASPELRKASTQGQFEGVLTTVHRKLGMVRATRNKTWRTGMRGVLVYVDLLQETQFETGTGMESFRFFVDKGVPTLAGYRIDSNDLMTH